MNTFLTKVAMLFLFLLSVTCAWSALTMVFPASLFNILLGILAAFFLLRAFELADKVNKLGPYAEEEENDNPAHRERPRPKNNEGEEEEAPHTEEE